MAADESGRSTSELTGPQHVRRSRLVLRVRVERLVIRVHVYHMRTICPPLAAWP